MGKPIPPNPTYRKVTEQPSQPEQKAVRVVIAPPAANPPVIPPKKKAEAISGTGQNFLKRLVRARKAGTNGGNR